MTVAFTITERADQRICSNAPAHPTALLQDFFWQNIATPGSVSTPTARFGSLRLLGFPQAKIAVESEDICECDGHKVHKLSQWRLTADCLAPWEGDCSQMDSKVSCDWLPNYIGATRPALEIFKMAEYFPDIPRSTLVRFLSLCTYLYSSAYMNMQFCSYVHLLIKYELILSEHVSLQLFLLLNYDECKSVPFIIS